MLKTLLNFRQKHHSLFIHGTLKELKVIGSENKSVMAFARVLRKEVLIVITPLFLHRLKNKKLFIQIPFDFSGVELLSGEKAVYKMGEHLPFEDVSLLKVLYMKKK